MDDTSREKFRRKLHQYPGASEEQVEEELERYEVREVQKRELLDRRFSNAKAEAWLDRSGYPRPPGWHSVFFYPGSMRPRNIVVFWVVVAAAVVAWVRD